MKKIKFGLVFLLAALAGCASSSKAPTMTPLEIQSLQTRDFESDKPIVFASVISVFQDLGYTIKAANKDTGIISAEGAAKSSEATKFWLGITSVSQTIATAFVEQIGKHTKVRLNFVNTNHKSSGYGQTDRQDTPILDAKVYQNAFEKIENAIFVRSSHSSK